MHRCREKVGRSSLSTNKPATARRIQVHDRKIVSPSLTVSTTRRLRRVAAGSDGLDDASVVKLSDPRGLALWKASQFVPVGQIRLGMPILLMHRLCIVCKRLLIDRPRQYGQRKGCWTIQIIATCCCTGDPVVANFPSMLHTVCIFPEMPSLEHDVLAVSAASTIAADSQHRHHPLLPRAHDDTAVVAHASSMRIRVVPVLPRPLLHKYDEGDDYDANDTVDDDTKRGDNNDAKRPYRDRRYHLQETDRGPRDKGDPPWAIISSSGTLPLTHHAVCSLPLKDFRTHWVQRRAIGRKQRLNKHELAKAFEQNRRRVSALSVTTTEQDNGYYNSIDKNSNSDNNNNNNNNDCMMELGSLSSSVASEIRAHFDTASWHDGAKKLLHSDTRQGILLPHDVWVLVRSYVFAVDCKADWHVHATIAHVPSWRGVWGDLLPRADDTQSPQSMVATAARDSNNSNSNSNNSSNNNDDNGIRTAGPLARFPLLPLPSDNLSTAKKFKARRDKQQLLSSLLGSTRVHRRHAPHRRARRLRGADFHDYPLDRVVALQSQPVHWVMVATSWRLSNNAVRTRETPRS